jgi:hypothetical protein
MQVSMLYFAGCPNWRNARQRLCEALDQVGRADTEVILVPVETDAQAATLGFAGSPTFTVDGDDLFEPAAPAGGLTCRMYATSAGLVGVPALTDLVAALREKVRP